MEVDSNINILNHSDHSQIGLRYYHMVLSFQELEKDYNEEDMHMYTNPNNFPFFVIRKTSTSESILRQHLRWWVRDLSISTELCCEDEYGVCRIPKKLRAKEDGRRELPTSIYKTLIKLPVTWKAKKVCLSWVVCFLDNIQLDIDNEGWDRFQCSHLCLGAGKNLPCLNSKHLVWESASDNQARGSRDCLKKCHCGCGKKLCVANYMHVPSCQLKMIDRQ